MDGNAIVTKTLYPNFQPMPMNPFAAKVELPREKVDQTAVGRAVITLETESLTPRLETLKALCACECV